ncbi:MAG: hypothetical protein JO334_13395 [Verrucomicrobia bacterium]|nr:hypothetical protein [Verrucomicrobiota bacterium]
MPKDLKRASAGISLVMLALGFSFLGIVPFVQRMQGESAIASALEQNCCIAGSFASLLAGTIFLIAACIYWRS